MDNHPLVSVIVCTYNSLPYVKETLESIKDQTYKNIELIISDDASTDGTVDFVKQWAKNNVSFFKDIILLTTPYNTGVTAHYNRVVVKANGAWIKMIAGDDILLPNCITDNLDYVKDNPDAQIIFSNNIIFFNDSTKTINYRPATTCPEFFELNAEDQYKKLLEQENISLNPSTKFASTKILKEYLLDERIRNIEDLQFNYKCTSNGAKLYYLDKYTVKYRKHAGALTGLPQKSLVSIPYVDSWIDFYYLYREKAFIEYGIDRTPYEKKILWYLFVKHFLKNKGNLITRPLYRVFRRILGF